MNKKHFVKMLLVFASASFIISASCSFNPSANTPADNSGINVYYVIEGIYDSVPDQPAREGEVEVIASMTMPDGSLSQGNILTPYTSSAREYSSGMTVTVDAESVLSYTTITVKIYKNGVLWKENSATETGFGNYADATVSGAL